MLVRLANRPLPCDHVNLLTTVTDLPRRRCKGRGAVSRCHSAGALLSLCFLAGAYEHAFALIQAFCELPMGVEVLVQVGEHYYEPDIVLMLSCNGAPANHFGSKSTSAAWIVRFMQACQQGLYTRVAGSHDSLAHQLR